MMGLKCTFHQEFLVILHSFLIYPTNPEEINDLINSLDDTKSCGPCSVPTKTLKLVSKEISIPLSNICKTHLIKVFSLIKIKLLRLSHLTKKDQQLTLITIVQFHYYQLLVKLWKN